MDNYNDTAVSLDVVNPVDTAVSIDTKAEGNPTPSAPVADVRSRKAAYGVGEMLGKSQTELYALIMQGKENDLRNEAATRFVAEAERKRIARVIDIVNREGKTLTIDQLNELRKPPADPNSIFEDSYAEKFLRNIFPVSADMDGTDVTTALSTAPQTVLADLEQAKTKLSNHDYARRKAEDIAQLYENQGTLPWIADQIKNIIPFYSDVKLRGWMKEVGRFDGWLQGSNLEEQTRTLLRLPGPQFREKLDEILTKLGNDNPTLALQYANAVLGMSTSDVGLANVNNIVEIVGLPGLTPAMKAGLKAVGGTRKAMSDAMKATANTATPTPATVAEGFGDAGTAATLRASEAVISDMKAVTEPLSNSASLTAPNNPINRAKQALPTGLTTDTATIAANGRPLSQELLNRIVQDQEVASKRIIDVIEKTAAVQRIPLEEAGPIVMKRIKDEVANQSAGIKNAIADIGDPVWNPFSKTYDFPVKIFNWTGEQFSTEAAARRFAKQHGIEEFEVVGKSGVKYFIPEAAVKRPWESGSRLGEVRAINGELKVFLDDGSEVAVSITPRPGMIPVAVDAKGGVKFEKTLRNAVEASKAAVAQQGLGYHLNIWKPLNEGENIIKDLMINLESTKSIASKGGATAWFNSLFPTRSGGIVGLMRSSDVTLSPFEVHQRKTATYSISNFQALLQNEMKHIQNLARGRVTVDEVTGEDKNAILSYIRTLSPITMWKAKDKWADFKRALEAAPSLKDPKTGANGYLLSSPYEINEFWRENFKRPASFEEIRGWLAFKRNYENDRVFRSMREYTNKARLGGEQHQVTYIDKTGNKVVSGFFDGVQHKTLPGGEYPILILDGPSPRVRWTNKMGSDYQRINKAVKDGEMVVTEIYAPELRPLKTMPDVGYNYIRYIVTPAGNRQTKPLSWEQVNRLSGGHFDYDHEFAVKQARVVESRAGNKTYHSYEGDDFLMFVNGNAQGRQVIKVLNKVKEHLRNKDVTAAREVFENGLKGENGPAMEWKDFIARTRPKKDEYGNKIPPQININEPFYVVPKGKSIVDMDDSVSRRYGTYDAQGNFTSTFQDRTKGGSLARQYQVGYTQERDADSPMALKNIGSKDNPIYKYEPATMVDPIVTMNRALNQIVRTTVMDDMKVASIETWLREAESLLKAPNVDDIRSSPWWYFKNADSPDAFKPGADRTVVANLLSNRFKTQQFLGTPSKYDLFMHDTAQKIADWSYDTLGPKGELVPSWLLEKTTSPINALRMFAYHTKLGLFAVPQLLTQSMTYLTIGSLAPRSAPAGAYAAMLTQWSKFATNKGTVDLLDKWASKINVPGFHGWKPGEWKEALEEMNNRGFANVGSEHNLLDTQLSHKYTQGFFGDALDAGQMFFKLAEQNVRYGAWFTAAKEYRVAHPEIKVLRKTDWDKILDRADDMSGNMSRASKSILQSGPLALTGQFLTYQMHLAELYFSKRMTMMDRFRMHMIYGSMFGATGAFGIMGLPLGESIRKAAYDNGYVVGDNILSTFLMEGAPAIGLAWLTSDDGDIKKGNFYNISDKFGVSGLTQFYDLLKSDAKWYTFLAGAAGSIAGNTWNNSEGLRRAGWDAIQASMMTGDESKELFKMTNDTWIDVLKEISSVDAARKGFAAVQYGKWLSKSDAYQADVSAANGIFMSLTGLNLQNAADNYVVGQSIKDRDERQKKALNHFTREFRRGAQAGLDNDWPTFEKYMTNAYAFLKAYDYPIEDYPKAVAIASQGWETRINSIRQEFYTQNVPAGKEDTYGDAFQRFLKTQDK
jgi:hypothetical protein